MELVYLWVEKYKNIENQGFNFSPRFECEYDGENLTITENKDYLSIFPENINVTAIVGKNGSGKSSVFESLSYLFWQGLILHRKDKTFFIFYSMGEFYIQCENYKSLPINESDLKSFINFRNTTKIKNPITFCARGQMPLIMFSNCISDITKNPRLQYLKTYDNYYNGIKSPKILIKNENTSDDFNQKFQFILKKNIDFFKFLNEDFIFNSYQSEIHFSEIEAIMVQHHNEELQKYLSFQNLKTDSKKELIYRLAIVLLIELTSSKLADKYQKENEDQPSEFFEEYLSAILESHIIELLDRESKVTENVYDKILQLCSNTLEEDVDFIKEIFNKENIKYLFKNYKSHNLPEDKSYTILKSDIFLINDDINNYKTNKLLAYLFAYQSMRFNFLNSENHEHNFLSLSSGEKLYINLLTNYTFTLLNLKDDYKGIMLFDEIELSFHPNWQKQVIKHLLYIKETISITKISYIHLIFSSHSPFILSDLPKENVIFLEKYKKDEDKNQKEGNCKNVSKDIELKTFGANIHTLLSDGFFMSDGLMGEFAKSKITEIKNFYNENKDLKNEDSNFESKKDEFKKNKKYFENIQKIIGEPFLQTIIKNYIDELEILFNGKKEFLDKEIKRLEELRNEIK